MSDRHSRGQKTLLWAEGQENLCRNAPHWRRRQRHPFARMVSRKVPTSTTSTGRILSRALLNATPLATKTPTDVSKWSAIPSNCKLPWNELPLAQTWRRADLAGDGRWATARLTPCLPICIIVCKWKWYLNNELISWELADRPLLIDNLPPNSSWARIGIRRLAGEPELDMPATAMISLSAGADGCGGTGKITNSPCAPGD